MEMFIGLETFCIGQILKHVHVIYSLLELLIFFRSTLVDIFCSKFDSLMHQRKNVRKYILQRKQRTEQKQREIQFHMSGLLMLKNPCLLMRFKNFLSTIFNCLQLRHCFLNTFLIILKHNSNFISIQYALAEA